MLWAHIETQLDKSRSSIKTIDELKRKVNFIWNRIPKKLCRKIAMRFASMCETVKKNGGQKENRKDRKDKKPLFKLSKNNNQFKHPFFTEYQDKIERIAYSKVTFDEFKEKYISFLDKEITFLNKILKANGIIS